MPVAGRLILAYHLGRLLHKETAVLETAEVEAIHEMRVATRRLRSAMRIFRGYYRKDATRSFRLTLRELAEKLGEVRDLDVYREHILSHSDEQAPYARRGLRAYAKALAYRRGLMTDALHAWLESDAYAHFLTEFVKFLNSDSRDIQPASPYAPIRICDVLPSLVYAQWAAIRAYEPHVSSAPSSALHLLRIEIKRLRYLLEAFTPILSDTCQIPINACKQMQEFLGELQDSQVAVAFTEAHLDELAMGRRAVMAYRDQRAEQGAQLRQRVLEAWAAFNTLQMRQALALSMAHV
ncbi:MAG: hypothetical protein OHK0023_27580 [Anaerolineae bacterium]